MVRLEQAIGTLVVQQINLSVILPVKSEARRLAAAVAECLAIAASQPGAVEIIIVDDAADHSTARLADRLAATHNSIAVMRFTRRVGYRRALYDAWGAASGQYLVALDLDGPASASDIPRLLAAAPGHVAVLGYREPPPRRIRERLFAATARRIAPELRDPRLGLALFHADQRALLDPSGPAGLAHAAVYAAARRRGLSVAQVAVSPGVGTPPPELAHPSGALGLGLLIAAGSLWLLRRLRRHPSV
jgi:glycosyltransferase involved in cell wall biosynthesis